MLYQISEGQTTFHWCMCKSHSSRGVFHVTVESVVSEDKCG